MVIQWFFEADIQARREQNRYCSSEGPKLLNYMNRGDFFVITSFSFGGDRKERKGKRKATTTRKALPPPALVDHRHGLVPPMALHNFHDRPSRLIRLLQIHAVALLHQDAQHVDVAILHRLQHGVPPAVHEVDVGAALKQQLQDLRVVAAHAPDRLDDGQVLAGRVDVGTSLVDQVSHDVLVALADGAGEGREHAAVLVFDAEAGGEQEADAIELVGADGHFDDALEVLGVGYSGEELLQNVGPLDGQVDGPVLAADGWVGTTSKAVLMLLEKS